MAYIGVSSSRREALLSDVGVHLVVSFGYKKTPWPINITCLDWTDPRDLESYSCHLGVETYVEQRDILVVKIDD